MVPDDNALLARLAPPDRADLLASAEDVPLARSQVQWQPGEPLAHVYFPLRGFVGLIVTDATPADLEIALVGREGMLGIQAALGVGATPFRAVVQAEGRAWRVPADVFQRHLDRHPATKALLDRYATFRLHQLATLAQCLHYHEVEPRLARWLLMGQDRAGARRLRVTQEALGPMLGVRRVSVTMAATDLQNLARRRPRPLTCSLPGDRGRATVQIASTSSSSLSSFFTLDLCFRQCVSVHHALASVATPAIRGDA